MPWFKVDDALPANHKVLSIPRGSRRLAAMGAWTLGGAWTAANLKEGFIPRNVLDELAIPAKVVADLVSAGLWLPEEHGYRMHDFLEYNPTAEQVLAERAAAAERQRRAREKARASRHAVTHAVTHADVTAVVTVPPTRPDPTQPVVGLPWEEEGEVELPASPDHFADPPPQQARRALRAVDATPCKHNDPHPHLCGLCEGERIRAGRRRPA